MSVLEASFDRDAPLECKLDRVSKQVKQDLPEPLLVSKDLPRDILLNLAPEKEVFLGHLEIHDLANLFNGLPDIKQLLEYLELVVLNAAHVKRVFNNVLEMQRRVEDYLQVVDDFGVQSGSKVQEYHPDDRDYRVKWRPQLVGD